MSKENRELKKQTKALEREQSKDKARIERAIAREQFNKRAVQFFIIIIVFGTIAGVGCLYAEEKMPNWLKDTSATIYSTEVVEPMFYHKNEVQAMADKQVRLENRLQEALITIKVTKDNTIELELLKGYLDDLRTGRVKIDTSVDLKYMIDEAIEEAYAKYPLATPNKIRAIMKQESQFNPLAVSHSGAMGLMQLMPSTATWLGVTNPWNVKQNVMGGAQYLSDQLKATNGDFRKALSYYNAGPNAPLASNGIANYKETQEYVKIVLKNYYEYEAHDAKARKGIK